jgi:hypothetical protein
MIVTTGLPVPSLGKDADHYQALETENTPLPSPGEKIFTTTSQLRRRYLLTYITQPGKGY